MVEFFSLDDVGQGYDMACAEPERIAVKLGRHPNDLMLSYYMRTPGGHPGGVRLGRARGGRRDLAAGGIDQRGQHVGSPGAVRGAWATPDMPAQTQRHAPVQVIDGNYQKMTGVCPGGTVCAGTDRSRPVRILSP